jgi:hypothetical protein
MTGHFEAKKHAYRQTQDGIVVSFVIHPNDVDSGFAVAPLGTRYMIGFAEIGDDGKPVTPAVAEQVDAPASAGDGSRAGASPVRESKDRKPFASLPLSQQAGMRCDELQFQTFMRDKHFAQGLSADFAADQVRFLCDITSRADLNDALCPGRNLWLELEKEYQAYLTDQRFAEARR